MTKASWLKTLFLSTAVMIAGGAQAQKTLDASVLKQANEHNIKRNFSLSPRTGVLFIRGPEEEKTSPYAPEINSKQIQPLREHFKNIPFRNVGNGIDSLSVDNILQMLDELADENIDNVIIINDTHGFARKHVEEGPDGLIAYDYFNNFGYKKDGSFLPHDSLYKSIGNRFKTNTKLKNVGLILLDHSCFGLAALRACHYLPEKSHVFFFANHDQTAAYMPQNHHFLSALKRLEEMALAKNKAPLAWNQKTAFVASIFAANSANEVTIDDKTHRARDRNPLHYVQITSELPDTLPYQGRSFSFGDHNGFIAKPDDILDSIAKTFTDDQIVNDLADYQDIVDEDIVRTALSAYRAMPDKTDKRSLSTKDDDCLSFIAVTMALKHPEFLENTLRHALNKGIIGVESKNSPRGIRENVIFN